MLFIPDDPGDAVEKALDQVVECIVVSGGGVFVGIQKPVPECGINYHLVMFNAPCGSTCALKMDEHLNTDSIRRKIQSKEAEFGNSCH